MPKKTEVTVRAKFNSHIAKRDEVVTIERTSQIEGLIEEGRLEEIKPKRTRKASSSSSSSAKKSTSSSTSSSTASSGTVKATGDQEAIEGFTAPKEASEG